MHIYRCKVKYRFVFVTVTKDSTNEVPLFRGRSETKYPAYRKFDRSFLTFSHMRNRMLPLLFL